MRLGKKSVFLCACALAALGPAFAELPAFRLSLGGGGLFMANHDNLLSGAGSPSESVSYRRFFENTFCGGAFAFLDAVFGELSIGFRSGMTIEEDLIYRTGALTLSRERHQPAYFILDTGLWGKFPFQLGPATVFPLLGLSYSGWPNELASTGEYFWNSVLWFMAGAGADFPLGPAFFLRAEALYGFHFQSPGREKVAGLYKEWYPGSVWEEQKPGYGLQVRVGLGYRF
jgi:hypothetical protein